MAAQFRDSGQSPEAAFRAIKKTFGSYLGVRTICGTVNYAIVKQLVNATYFDPRFAGSNVDAIAAGLRQRCEAELLERNNPRLFPKYQPLK
jgi:hypothetical protein